jgi:hypothetical protein
MTRMDGASEGVRGAEDVRVPGSREERASALQWIGFFLPPAVFFAHLQIGFVLIPWTCTKQQPFWVDVVGIASVILAALGTFAAWITWRRAGREEPGEGPGSLPRTRFIGAVGLGMNAIITLILLLQWVAGLFISVCQ